MTRRFAPRVDASALRDHRASEGGILSTIRLRCRGFSLHDRHAIGIWRAGKSRLLYEPCHQARLTIRLICQPDATIPMISLSLTIDFRRCPRLAHSLGYWFRMTWAGA